jgi:hypothetical protein
MIRIIADEHRDRAQIGGSGVLTKAEDHRGQ